MTLSLCSSVAFVWGVPPKKQGDYAYLLHIIRSMKSTGKAACILPHGVLFRGNAEGVIRERLIRSGYLKAIIGLPANLFYGTGIPACIVVLDKTNAAMRKGVFMIDASKGFIKDGPKNRLREQDVHRIVDAFSKQDGSDTRFARMVPVDEISGAKNDFNLNLPRYVDSSEPEDMQDIDAHLRGGIPERDIDDPVRLGPYWTVLPGLRDTLFEPGGRPGYCRLLLPLAKIKPAIFNHPEFAVFQDSARKLIKQWKAQAIPRLKSFDKNSHPKPLIGELSESLLTLFKTANLLRPYDIYQHLMDYWAGTMQDDCYLISVEGWNAAAAPHEIFQVKNKDGKLVWTEPHDFRRGKRRFKSDLIPAVLLVDHYFAAERDRIGKLEVEKTSVELELDELFEEHGGEDGLLNDVIDGEGEKRKVVAKAVRPRLKAIGRDVDYADERKMLQQYAALLDRQADTKAAIKATTEELEAKLDAKYPTLTTDEIKTIAVDDKWVASLAASIENELDRVSRTLTGRIRQLAERYAMPLPQLTDAIALLNKQVDEHLRRMGAVWN
jgi:type I restriction enzyme M protein